MDHKELIQDINKDMAIVLPDHVSLEELKSILISHINLLIGNDFHKLIAVLYRMDVSEPKLKQLLQKHPEEDAANIIAGLIIERQLQKIKTRQEFGRRHDNITGEETW